ncbi:Glutathione-regulated potassium-efflux system ancillary protein KefF [uncultured archaeon]|nr:Glutathione-regulated potassium-efflux system ancillary protein KefF [uncultured archaeon]
MDLVIFAHPQRMGSHNGALLQLVMETLKASSRPFELIDLYADGFDPLLNAQEYGVTVKVGTPRSDPLVAKYQQLITKAERLIFIYPVWWYGAPAMLKGFFDRVFTPGFAYNFKKMPPIAAAVKPVLPALCSIGACYPIFLSQMPVDKKLAGKRAIVVNTYGGGAEGFSLFGRAPEFSVDKAVLGFCGISPVKRISWWEARGEPIVPERVKKQIEEALAR